MDFYGSDEWEAPAGQPNRQRSTPPPPLHTTVPPYVPTHSYESSQSRKHSAASDASSIHRTSNFNAPSPSREGFAMQWQLSYEPPSPNSGQSPSKGFVPPAYAPVLASQPHPPPSPNNLSSAAPYNVNPAATSSLTSDLTSHPVPSSPRSLTPAPAGPVEATAEVERQQRQSWSKVTDTMDEIRRMLQGGDAHTFPTTPAYSAPPQSASSSSTLESLSRVAARSSRTRRGPSLVRDPSLEHEQSWHSRGEVWHTDMSAPPLEEGSTRLAPAMAPSASTALSRDHPMLSFPVAGSFSQPQHAAAEPERDRVVHASASSRRSPRSSLHAPRSRLSQSTSEVESYDEPFFLPAAEPTSSFGGTEAAGAPQGPSPASNEDEWSHAQKAAAEQQIEAGKPTGKWDSISVQWTLLSKNRRKNPYLCIAGAMPEPILTVFTQGALTPDHLLQLSLNQALRLSGPPILPPGDDYSGGWMNGLPSGDGKYMWADGSCYVGSWLGGMPDGTGIYSWASGAFFEGGWKQGCMEGQGTYSDGAIGIYLGSWHDHKMHGWGMIEYVGGDKYEGLVVDGQLDGPGLYTWSDGSRYNGMFVRGQRDGRGTFVMQGKEMFFGEFVEGYEHGRGVYTLPDFSFFDGVWVDGVRHGVGVSFPPPEKDAKVFVTEYMHGRKMREEAASDTFLLTYTPPPMHSARHAHRMASTTDALLDRLLRTDGERARERRGSAKHVSGLASEVQNYVASSNEATRSVERSEGSAKMNCNKLGETVYMGTASYDLMLNLQVGIQNVVSTVTGESLRACNAADFEDEDGNGVLYPRLGSEHTPPHPSTQFHFKDYCPMVFRNLRDKAGISVGDYIQSLCGDAALREMSTPGKSGASFFISNNDKLLIKTLTKEEFTTLHTLLPKLYQHTMQHPNTMLCQFYGVYRMMLHTGVKVRMVVMSNILCTTAPLHRRFDLKGSTQGRYTKKTLAELKPTSILKDLDLDLQFKLPSKWLNTFNEQLHADSLFLEAMGLIDYSMLVGVHFRDAKKAPELMKGLGNKFVEEELEDPFEQYTMKTTSLDLLTKQSNRAMPTALPSSPNNEGELATALNFRPWVARDRRASMQGFKMAQNKARDAFFNRAGPEKLTTEQLAEARGEESRLGNAMVATVTPGRVFSWPEDSNVSRPPTLKQPHEAVIYFGIIDFLQAYNIRKRIEHQGKAMLYLNKTSISVTNPAAYSSRFQLFMNKLFGAQNQQCPRLNQLHSTPLRLHDIM